MKAPPWPALEKAREFRAMVAEAKRRIGNSVEWYPYDTLSALAHFDRLLGAANRHLLEPREGARRVLDLGCGDGEMSLFLEWLGFEVVAADHPRYNHNGMRGIRALREALGSRMEIHEIDLDALTFPHGSYDLIILLGVLYHLRNPFYALEQMARNGTRCLLSTRVAGRLPGGKWLPKEAAWAYLLDENEIAGDDSNYFVFSDAALRLLLKRTHWRVLDYLNTGATGNSEPVRLDRDERVFCLIQSEHDRLADLELGEGWYPREETGWRWTRRSFSAMVPAPSWKGRSSWRWKSTSRASCCAGRSGFSSLSRSTGAPSLPPFSLTPVSKGSSANCPPSGTARCAWTAPPTHAWLRTPPTQGNGASWFRV